MSHLEGKKKFKILAQENNEVCLFEEMTNASALSEKKPPLVTLRGFEIFCILRAEIEGEDYENRYDVLGEVD